MKYLWFASKCLLILVVMSLVGFYLAIRPLQFISHLDPQNLGLHFEKVVFETSDQVALSGWFIPAKSPTKKTIILLHGYPADKGNILPVMAFLHQHYNLFLFDFRYFGDSGGHYTTIGKDEVKDLLAAIKYLRTRRIDQVGVWGFSLGGAVALMTAPLAPEMKAIVAESSYARLDWMATDYFKIPLLKYPLKELTRYLGILVLGYDIRDVSPAEALAKISVPVLLIQSRNDNVIPHHHALLFEEIAAKQSNIEIINSSISAHGELMPEHDKIILNFFDKNL